MKRLLVCLLSGIALLSLSPTRGLAASVISTWSASPAVSDWGSPTNWDNGVPHDIARTRHTAAGPAIQPDLQGNSYAFNFLDLNGDNGDRIDGNGVQTVGGLITLWATNTASPGVGLRTYTGGRTHYVYANIDLGMADRSVTNTWWMRKLSEGGGAGNCYLYGQLGGTGSLLLYNDPANGGNNSENVYFAYPGSLAFDGDTYMESVRTRYYPSNIVANTTFRFGTKAAGEATITLDSSNFVFAPVSDTTDPTDATLANNFVIANTGVSTVYRSRGRALGSETYPNVIYSGTLTLAGPLFLTGDSGNPPVPNGNGTLFTLWTGGLVLDQTVAATAMLREGRDGSTLSLTMPLSDSATGEFCNPFLPGMDRNGLLVLSNGSSSYKYGTVVGWCGNVYDTGNWTTLAAANHNGSAVSATVAGGMGTGNVTVTPGGRLNLSVTGVLPASRSVLVQANGSTAGLFGLPDDGTTDLPAIDSASTGIIGTEGASDAKFNALMAAGAGNNMFLGSGVFANGTFTGATLSPGNDGVYRLCGGDRSLTMDVTGTDQGVLADVHDVQINTGGYNGGGTVYLSDTNDFVGTITVYGNLLEPRTGGVQGEAAIDGSPFGFTNNPVALYGAHFTLLRDGDTGGGVGTVGDMVFSGDSMIELSGGTTTFKLEVNSLTRADKAQLRVHDTHDLGVGNYKICVKNPGVDLTPANGMVAPYYLHDNNNTLDFATFDAVTGFAKVTYSANPLNTAGANDLVNQGALVLGGDAQCYALRTSGNITASAESTITIGGGGLILGGNLGTATNATLVNLNFGGKEGIIYGTGDRYLYGKVSNTGGNGLSIATAGSGNYTRLVNRDNTFTGTVTVNGGILEIVPDADDDSGTGSLGPGSNSIRMNGGYLAQSSLGPSGWTTLASTRTLTLGPSGGGLGSPTGNRGLTVDGKITGSGPLYLSGNGSFVIDNAANDWTGGTLVNSSSGGTGCSATGAMGQGPVILMSIGYNTCHFTFNGDGNLHYTGGAGAYLPLQVSGISLAAFKSQTPVMGTLTGDGAVVLGNNNVNDTTLTVGLDGANGTFYGIISQVNNTVGKGVGSLVKDGPGTFTLYGPHTYTGETDVNGGTLRLMGSVAGNMVVGANGTIEGGGKVGGALTVDGAFAVTLSSDFHGLTVGGAVAFNAGSQLTVATPDFNPGEHTYTALTGASIGSLDNLTVQDGYVAKVVGNELQIYRTRGTLMMVK